MKTYETLPDGSRLVRVTREEWDGLATATDLAYQDPDAVPVELRPVGESLYRDFHEPSGATRREREPAPEKPWRWSPFTILCQSCGLRSALSWDCLADCVQQGLIGALPDGDAATIEKAARAVTLGEVADAAEYCLHCVMGDEAPAAEYVTEGDSFAGGGRGVAEFVVQGVPFFPAVQFNAYLGVYHRRGVFQDSHHLVRVPMGKEVATETLTEIEALIVTDPAGLDLALINRVLGSEFTPEQFGAAS